jgi:ABC-type transporter Mla MlaB component
MRQLFCDFIAENVMFKITVLDNPTEEMWILQGQLTGEFASELSTNWRVSQDRCAERSRVVDLSDVTSIDKNGEAVLLKMIHERARFVATGLYTKHLLEELQARIHEEQKAD